jgi:hypothetical protein
MTEFGKRTSTINGKGLRCIDYLITKSTTPEELFGLISVAGLKRDEYQRIHYLSEHTYAAKFSVARMTRD